MAEVSLALNTIHKLATNKECGFKNICSKFYVLYCNSLLQKFDLDSKFLKCIEIPAHVNIMKNPVKRVSQLCKQQ